MKTIVSDFDLTFYTNDFIKNIEVINDFVNRGNKFIIATGRNIKSLKSIIDHYDIKVSHIICNDGATIYDTNNNLLTRHDLNYQDGLEIYKLISKLTDDVWFDNGYELVKETDIINGVVGHYFDYDKAQILLHQIENKYPQVHGYLSQNYINITNIVVTKANGVKYLEEHFNYPDIYVVGDRINDLSLYLNYRGIALANSKPELKANSIIEVLNFKEAVIEIEKRP